MTHKHILLTFPCPSPPLAGGDKLKKQKAAVAKLRKDIDDAEAEATRRAVQAKSHAKTVERVRKDLAKDGEQGPWGLSDAFRWLSRCWLPCNQMLA